MTNNNKKGNTSLELSEWAQRVAPGFGKSLEAAEKAVHVNTQSNSNNALMFQKPPLSKQQKEENVGLLKRVNEVLVATANLELEQQQSFAVKKN